MNIFQQKLARHELPIDDSFWAEMETRLNSKQRKQFVPLRAWLSGAAASLALLVGLNLFFNSNKISVPPVAEIQSSKFKIQSSGEKQQDNLTENISVKNNNITTATTTVIKVCGGELTGDPIQTVNPAPADTVVSEKTEIAEQKNSIQPKITNRKPPTANRKKLSLSVAANYGGQSAIGGGQTDLAYANNSSEYKGLSKAPAYALANAAEQITIEQILQDYPVENHLPPLSFSISLRKNFGKYFALETGLTYTYLHSKFSNDRTWDNGEWQHDRATLTQHYLGIPLAVVVNIVNNKTLNVYFSLGGMAEKGVWLDYNKDITYSYTDIIYNQQLQEKIGGMQWSAAAAMGVSYRFSDNFSLYAEPKLNFYFDCAQPRSFRTQSPLNVGLNAGLRVEF